MNTARRIIVDEHAWPTSTPARRGGPPATGQASRAASWPRLAEGVGPDGRGREAPIRPHPARASRAPPPVAWHNGRCSAPTPRSRASPGSGTWPPQAGRHPGRSPGRCAKYPSRRAPAPARGRSAPPPGGVRYLARSAGLLTDEHLDP